MQKLTLPILWSFPTSKATDVFLFFYLQLLLHDCCQSRSVGYGIAYNIMVRQASLTRFICIDSFIIMNRRWIITLRCWWQSCWQCHRCCSSGNWWRSWWQCHNCCGSGNWSTWWSRWLPYSSLPWWMWWWLHSSLLWGSRWQCHSSVPWRIWFWRCSFLLWQSRWQCCSLSSVLQLSSAAK